MIDIGVNLTHARFDPDRDEVLARARAAGINHMLLTGTDVESSRQALALCRQNPALLSCTAGVHPHDAEQVGADYLDELSELAADPAVKAIGECGLDFNRNFSSPERQLAVFAEQIALAQRLQLPLFLHQRDAFEPWFSLLQPYVDKIPAMVSHCFTGNADELRRCLSSGMYIGITGWLCDERRGQELRAIVKDIPLDRLMLETDAPFLLPRTMRPKPKSSRNEPGYLPWVVKSLALAMQVSEQEIIAHTSANAARVFNLGSAR